MLGSGHFIIRSIRSINPAVAVLTLLTLGHAQTRLALLSLTRKVLDKNKRATEIRLLPCNAGRGAKQGYRYQFSELGYSQTLQLERSQS